MAQLILTFKKSRFPMLMILAAALILCTLSAGHHTASGQAAANRMKKRWLFVWRDMSDPKEVDRLIARFPAAKAEGYNGVAFSYNVPAAKATELRQAAQKNGISLIA